MQGGSPPARVRASARKMNGILSAQVAPASARQSAGRRTRRLVNPLVPITRPCAEVKLPRCEIPNPAPIWLARGSVAGLAPPGTFSFPICNSLQKQKNRN